MNKNHQVKEERLPNGDGSFLTEETLKGFSDSVSDLSGRIKFASTEAAEKSIGFVKKYPIHSTLGAALIGFFIGSLSQKSK